MVDTYICEKLTTALTKSDIERPETQINLIRKPNKGHLVQVSYKPINSDMIL